MTDTAPLECVQCGRAIGPQYPVGADCAGWMCEECYKRLNNAEATK